MPSALSIVFRYLVADLIIDVVRFPFWWYTGGVVRLFRWYREQLHDASDRLAIVVLAKNLGRPMFGDYTREGKAISFFVRIIQFFVSLVLVAVWWLALTAVALCWFAVVPAIIWCIVYSWPHA